MIWGLVFSVMIQKTASLINSDGRLKVCDRDKFTKP